MSEVVSVPELAALLDGLELDDAGVPVRPLVFVRFTGPGSVAAADAAGAAARQSAAVLVGLAPDGVGPAEREVAAALALTLCGVASADPATVTVPDLDAAVVALESAVTANPRAAVTLVGLLRATAALPVDEGLVAESLAYSMLLAGTEFARWRASRPLRPLPTFTDPAVLVVRDGPRLGVTINRPQRHNAFSRDVRDGLAEAFDLARLDPSITTIRLSGNGRSFCSGGDLDEFGLSADVTTAHLIRIDRSVAARVARVSERTHVRLHGACIGAGIEIPSYAGHVTATDDAFFQLPELAMGLVPGAGGTVGITRRIGRWRTAYLALTGERIGVGRALEWGLVDARAE